MNRIYFLVSLAGSSPQELYDAVRTPASRSGRLLYLHPRAMDTVLKKCERDAREISALTEHAKKVLENIDGTQM